MLKKEELVALGIFLLFISLFIYSNGNEFRDGFMEITGFSVIEPDISITKTELLPGENISGNILLNFTEPFSPSTKIRVSFNGVEEELTLTDYFTDNGISFIEEPNYYSAHNPNRSREFIFSGESTKNFAFKLPKDSDVRIFTMTLRGNETESPTFVSIDIEDYANKKEWLYLGKFIDFEESYVYPSSLDFNNDGDPTLINSNQTYYCEAITLPESKDFRINAKLKKTLSGTADIKAVILSFDGTYGFGGAEFCNIPEPTVGNPADWHSCQISFVNTKKGRHLICVYYEGLNGINYYELTKDNTISNSRYNCPITTMGSTPCTLQTSRDYFIGIQNAKYDGVLNQTVDWDTGATEQKMIFSLTSFLDDCNTDELGDCVIPATISSKSSGKIELNNLEIEYYEGFASSKSVQFYDYTEVPGKIITLRGTSLEDSTKGVTIPLSSFGFKAPDITGSTKNISLSVEVIGGDTISSSIKVINTGFIHDTSTLETKLGKIIESKNSLESTFSEEMEIFDIDIDSEGKLSQFQNDINGIKYNSDITVSEANDQLSDLSDEIDAYLADQPIDFRQDTQFKDVIIIEPGDINKILIGDTDKLTKIYDYQDNANIEIETTNYILEKYEGTTEKYAMIKKTIKSSKTLNDIDIYEIIPKEVSKSVTDIFFKDTSFTIIENDPIVKYAVNSLKDIKIIKYGVKGVKVTSEMNGGLLTIIVPKSDENLNGDKPHECGDGVCTVPYEDKEVCPEDCGGFINFPWELIIIFVVLVIAGIVYLNFYKRLGGFKKLVPESPFKYNKNLEDLKVYMKSSRNKGAKDMDIANLLVKNGWTKYQIIYAFEDIKWDQKRAFTVQFTPKPKDNVKKLDTFIKKCLQLNMSIKRIVYILKQKGWTMEKINERFKNIKRPRKRVYTKEELFKKEKLYFEGKVIDGKKKK